jgi:hypothetical protein
MIVVVILVAAWGVILGPSLLRRRSEHGGGVSSISHFHNQLRVLEQSRGEPIVFPAFRLQSVPGEGSSDVPNSRDNSARPVLTVVGAKELPRPALAFLGEAIAAEETISSSFSGFQPMGTGMARPANPDARLLARRRRRDTLSVLALVFTLTLVIGSIPGARPAWVVTAIAGVALGAYVALLAHMQRVMAEGERKLRYLRPETGQSMGRDEYLAMAQMQDQDIRYGHPAGRAVSR